MQASDTAKVAISVASGTIAMGLAYLVFLRKRDYSVDTTPIDKEPWPINGTIEEKEALIDEILKQPCMLEAIRDPTRNEKFMDESLPMVQDYKLTLVSLIGRIGNLTESQESQEVFHDQLDKCKDV